MYLYSYICTCYYICQLNAVEQFDRCLEKKKHGAMGDVDHGLPLHRCFSGNQTLSIQVLYLGCKLLAYDLGNSDHDLPSYEPPFSSGPYPSSHNHRMCSSTRDQLQKSGPSVFLNWSLLKIHLRSNWAELLLWFKATYYPLKFAASMRRLLEHVQSPMRDAVSGKVSAQSLRETPLTGQ